jgi:hypothetical protein
VTFVAVLVVVTSPGILGAFTEGVLKVDARQRRPRGRGVVRSGLV